MDFEVRSLFLKPFSEKYYSFDSRGDVINPKLDQKGPKVLFHALMVTER